MRSLQPYSTRSTGSSAPTSREAAVDAGYNDIRSNAPSSADSQSQFPRFLTFVSRKWWVLLLSVVFSGAVAAAYVLYWPVSFVSTAHVWAAGRMGLRLAEGTTYSEEGQNFGGTQVELLQSGKIQGRALLKIQNTLRLSIPTNSEGLPELVEIAVTPLPKSAILELRAKGPTDEYTRAFLDATMDEFLAYKREVRAANSGDTYTSVSEQITKQEGELKAAQDKLTLNQRENNVAVLEEQAKAASVYLTRLLAEFSQLRLEFQLLEATTGQNPAAVATATNLIAAATNVLQLATAASPRTLLQSGFSSAPLPPEFLLAEQELEKARIIRSRLGKVLRPKHPKMVKLDEEISRAAQLVEFLRAQSREQLNSAKQTVMIKRDQTEQAIREWEAKVNNASERIAEFERLKLNVERLQGLHDRLLGLLQTVDVSRNLDQENITILERASETKPGKKPAPLVFALALFMGAASGLGLIMLIAKSDDRVMSLDELGTRFDEWIVGQVPEVPKARKKQKPALLEWDDRRHVFAESYRSLRSALFFAQIPANRPTLLMVTSAVPHEGKSTVAANLARAMAFAGSRVLLVDGDLRRGVLHDLFQVPREPGFADLLRETCELRDIVVETNVPNLFLLPRGKPVSNGGELLLGKACDRFLGQAREAYDCVIMDSSPVFAADDTTSVAPKVDGVLFVVRGSYSGTRMVQRALEMLYERQAQVMGLIYNRADSTAGSYRYYQYSEYYPAAKTA